MVLVLRIAAPVPLNVLLSARLYQHGVHTNFIPMAWRWIERPNARLYEGPGWIYGASLACLIYTKRELEAINYITYTSNAVYAMLEWNLYCGVQ